MQTDYQQNPSQASQGPTVQPIVNPYYQTHQTYPDGQQLYLRDPEAAVRDRTSLPVAPTATPLSSWFDYSNSSYIKGALVGAGVTLLVTSPAVQTAVVKGAVAVWSTIVGGVEEVKERVRDARAEKSMT